MTKERSRHSAAQPRRRRWNRGDLAILLCGVLAFFVITFGGPVFQQTHLSPGTAPGSRPAGISSPAPAATPAAAAGRAPEGQQPAPETTVAHAPAPVLPAAAEPVHIRYPAAAFDVPVHALALDANAEASQTINPPATKDGYWLVPFGSPGHGSENTTYVIGHSWDGADAPFNHLSSAAAVGDLFEVDTKAGTIPYRVDSVTTYLKSSLKDSPVWEIVPNRLVLISCYTEDPWGKNVVVIASPAAP